MFGAGHNGRTNTRKQTQQVYDNNGNTIDELRRKADDLCADNTGFLPGKMARADALVYVFDRDYVGDCLY
jgi:hypothetical protein